ncbi:hypothetical protein DP939_37675 [Spongiactinospora rosea]|uniref:Uncharacterized protein n=1 Tax=Spongiactinospora rosea TaxID=2248750 RepID=A0A366LN47_9ACTN|nr:hypothetical protein DP939_37675 [Spongiactinospora rosea]
MGLVLGDPWLWVAVEWSSPGFMKFYMPDGLDGPTVVVLLMAAVVKAAFLWVILRRPAPGALDRRAKMLRRLLYLAVAYTLVLWFPLGLVPDEVGAAFLLGLWTAIDVLYLLVIRWRSRGLRVVAGVLFGVELAGMVGELLDELDVLEFDLGGVLELGLSLGGVAVTLITVVGQSRDGRWSRGTLAAGWASVGVHMLVLPLNIFFGTIPSGGLVIEIVMDAVGLVGVVWMAATAREMPIENRLADPSPARQRVARVGVVAVVVVPVIALIQPEQSPRVAYTGWSGNCYDRPAFGDLKPAERDATFLCLARSTSDGVPPMFPDELSDEAILAYARTLCRAKDREERQAILMRAGSTRALSGVDSSDLVYVCPEIIGATQPELLYSTKEANEAGAAYLAEENAKCRDPWPRTKGVVQATAVYYLFPDGDPGYSVHDPDDEAPVREEEYDGSTLTRLSRSSVLVGHIEDIIDLCLTVKAFRTAPPRRAAGWDLVDEVPIVSRSGRLTVPELTEGDGVGAGAPMPNLAIAGKGHYRLRVYVRTDDAAEEHLVVVFPGASRKRLSLKP